MESLRFLIFFAFFLVELGLARGDTPANCTKDDIVGEWLFYRGETSMDPNLDCSEMSTIKKKIKIVLGSDNVATENSWVSGTWTMIYNQGFEVNINSRTYYAFSMYKQRDGNVTSICGRTLLGKSHDVTLRNFACFYGSKKGASTVHKYHTDIFFNHPTFTAPRPDRGVHEQLVREINEKQSSWFAAVHEPFVSKTPAELLYYRGGPKSYLAHKVTATHTKGFRALANETHSLDWSNLNGENFVSPVRNQGQCGSCYAFSSVGMIESRLRVYSRNEQQPILSPQDILSCSDLSQGCSGGFPYLIAGRYGWEKGIAEESCEPYKGYDGTCVKQPCMKNRWYTAQYNYIGGAYGRCNEQAMLVALFQGPISVSFEVYPDFMHYKSGIYHYTGIKGLEPFIVVNHAVLLVGFGVDNQTSQKYWIVKNSWGSDWGENGYFRIRRGTDEVGIESCAVQAVPIPI